MIMIKFMKKQLVPLIMIKVQKWKLIKNLILKFKINFYINFFMIYFMLNLLYGKFKSKY